MKTLYKKFDIELKNTDKDTNTIEAIFSTQGEDRHGDIVIQDGFDLKAFKKNPVILNSHNHSDATEVIGKVKKGTLKIENKKMTGKIQFAVDENPKAKIIYDLYANKYLNAFSVGFIPKQYDEKDMSKIMEAELIEISAVSVPANSQALAKAKSAGINVDKLYEQSNKDNKEDKENEKSSSEKRNSSKGGGEKSKTEETSDTKAKQKENEEIEKLKAELEKTKKLLEEKEEKKVEKKVVKKETAEEKINKYIEKYKNNKTSSLARINKALMEVSKNCEVDKGNKTDNNYLVNSAIKKLLKLKDKEN